MLVGSFGVLDDAWSGGSSVGHNPAVIRLPFFVVPILLMGARGGLCFVSPRSSPVDGGLNSPLPLAV